MARVMAVNALVAAVDARKDHDLNNVGMDDLSKCTGYDRARNNRSTKSGICYFTDGSYLRQEKVIGVGDVWQAHSGR